MGRLNVPDEVIVEFLDALDREAAAWERAALEHIREYAAGQEPPTDAKPPEAPDDE